MKSIEHKATVITARYSSNCPYCGFKVNPGEKCKVYSDEWYHMNCWEKKFSNVMDNRKDNEIASLKLRISTLEDSIAKILHGVLDLRSMISEVEK